MPHDTLEQVIAAVDTFYDRHMERGKHSVTDFLEELIERCPPDTHRRDGVTDSYQTCDEAESLPDEVIDREADLDAVGDPGWDTGPLVEFCEGLIEEAEKAGVIWQLDVLAVWVRDKVSGEDDMYHDQDAVDEGDVPSYRDGIIWAIRQAVEHFEVDFDLDDYDEADDDD